MSTTTLPTVSPSSTANSNRAADSSIPTATATTTAAAAAAMVAAEGATSSVDRPHIHSSTHVGTTSKKENKTTPSADASPHPRRNDQHPPSSVADASLIRRPSHSHSLSESGPSHRDVAEKVAAYAEQLIRRREAQARDQQEQHASSLVFLPPHSHTTSIAAPPKGMQDTSTHPTASSHSASRLQRLPPRATSAHLSQQQTSSGGNGGGVGVGPAALAAGLSSLPPSSHPLRGNHHAILHSNHSNSLHTNLYSHSNNNSHELSGGSASRPSTSATEAQHYESSRITAQQLRGQLSRVVRAASASSSYGSRPATAPSAANMHHPANTTRDGEHSEERVDAGMTVGPGSRPRTAAAPVAANTHTVAIHHSPMTMPLRGGHVTNHSHHHSHYDHHQQHHHHPVPYAQDISIASLLRRGGSAPAGGRPGGASIPTASRANTTLLNESTTSAGQPPAHTTNAMTNTTAWGDSMGIGVSGGVAAGGTGGGVFSTPPRPQPSASSFSLLTRHLTPADRANIKALVERALPHEIASPPRQPPHPNESTSATETTTAAAHATTPPGVDERGGGVVPESVHAVSPRAAAPAAGVVSDEDIHRIAATVGVLGAVASALQGGTAEGSEAAAQERRKGYATARSAAAMSLQERDRLVVVPHRKSTEMEEEVGTAKSETQGGEGEDATDYSIFTTATRDNNGEEDGSETFAANRKGSNIGATQTSSMIHALLSDTPEGVSIRSRAWASLRPVHEPRDVLRFREANLDAWARAAFSSLDRHLAAQPTANSIDIIKHVENLDNENTAKTTGSESAPAAVARYLATGGLITESIRQDLVAAAADAMDLRDEAADTNATLLDVNAIDQKGAASTEGRHAGDPTRRMQLFRARLLKTLGLDSYRVRDAIEATIDADTRREAQRQHQTVVLGASQATSSAGLHGQQDNGSADSLTPVAQQNHQIASDVDASSRLSGEDPALQRPQLPADAAQHPTRHFLLTVMTEYERYIAHLTQAHDLSAATVIAAAAHETALDLHRTQRELADARAQIQSLEAGKAAAEAACAQTSESIQTLRDYVDELRVVIAATNNALLPAAPPPLSTTASASASAPNSCIAPSATLGSTQPLLPNDPSPAPYVVAVQRLSAEVADLRVHNLRLSTEGGSLAATLRKRTEQLTGLQESFAATQLQNGQLRATLKAIHVYASGLERQLKGLLASRSEVVATSFEALLSEAQRTHHFAVAATPLGEGSMAQCLLQKLALQQQQPQQQSGSGSASQQPSGGGGGTVVCHYGQMAMLDRGADVAAHIPPAPQMSLQHTRDTIRDLFDDLAKPFVTGKPLSSVAGVLHLLSAHHRQRGTSVSLITATAAGGDTSSVSDGSDPAVAAVLLAQGLSKKILRPLSCDPRATSPAAPGVPTTPVATAAGMPPRRATVADTLQLSTINASRNPFSDSATGKEVASNSDLGRLVAIHAREFAAKKMHVPDGTSQTMMYLRCAADYASRSAELGLFIAMFEGRVPHSAFAVIDARLRVMLRHARTLLSTAGAAGGGGASGKRASTIRSDRVPRQDFITAMAQCLAGCLTPADMDVLAATTLVAQQQSALANTAQGPDAAMLKACLSTDDVCYEVFFDRLTNPPPVSAWPPQQGVFDCLFQLVWRAAGVYTARLGEDLVRVAALKATQLMTRCQSALLSDGLTGTAQTTLNVQGIASALAPSQLLSIRLDDLTVLAAVYMGLLGPTAATDALGLPLSHFLPASAFAASNSSTKAGPASSLVMQRSGSVAFAASSGRPGSAAAIGLKTIPSSSQLTTTGSDPRTLAAEDAAAQYTREKLELFLAWLVGGVPDLQAESAPTDTTALSTSTSVGASTSPPLVVCTAADVTESVRCVLGDEAQSPTTTTPTDAASTTQPVPAPDMTRPCPVLSVAAVAENLRRFCFLLPPPPNVFGSGVATNSV